MLARFFHARNIYTMRILSLTLAVTAAIGLAACGSNGGPASGSANNNQGNRPPWPRT